MSIIDRGPEPAAGAPIPPIRAARPAGRSRWTRGAILGAMLVGGVALGAGGLAAATQHGWMKDGSRIERMQGMARRTLDSVGATSDQEAKVHDIIAAAFAEMGPAREKRQAFRKQALELLKAPTLDTAAIETLRAGHIADMDADSKRLTKAVTDIAGVLTPDQRIKVADRVEAFMAHGPKGRWGHGPGMGGRHGGHHGGPDRDGRPDGRDDAPDDGPGPQ